MGRDAADGGAAAPGQRALLDACVLYPTVLRELLLGVAGAGLFAPVWSARIIAEWCHAAARLGAEAEAVARAEAALMQRRFPGAMATDDEGRALGLDLPDPADRHVVAAAMAAGAAVIVTANLRDFPRGAMGAVGLRARHPDAFLRELWLASPGAVAGVVDTVHRRALAAGGAMDRRQMLKRVRLPRLAKALASGG